MDLFTYSRNSASLVGTPLAEKLRPKNIDEVLGQVEYLGEGRPLRALLEKDQIPSLIIWGPPGSGKTSLAMALAHQTKKEFVNLNAIDTGAKTLREVGQAASHRRLMNNLGTIVFIDEIHRLNKAQQDVLLPFVEKGDFILIGATTENPSFQVNSALLSRCRLLVFKRLDEPALRRLLQRAFADANRKLEETLSEDLQQSLFSMADGDGRRLINLAEQILFYFQTNPDGQITAENLKTILGESVLYHDRKGDSHYDTISAFIKSIRGSDPDAALYYLARMIEAGEDPLFIARRLVILASEDVGNAEPRALQVAIAGMQAVDFVGLPEAAINLAQVVTFLASAPKSNRSYVGLRKAQAEVRKTGNLPIPLAVRNAPTSMMKELGYGKNYQYAHEGERGWLPQEFLPEGLTEARFYEPSDRGFEKQIKAYLEWLRQPKKDS